MSQNVPESDSYDATLTVVSDGDGANGANFLTHFQKIANRTKYLYNRLIGVTIAPSAPPGANQNGPSDLKAHIERLANRILAITGATNWWDTPTKTLVQLNAEKAALTGATFTGAVNLQASSGNSSLEIGKLAAAETPFFDFHSSGLSTDYDVRLLASGGNATAGTGILDLTAATFRVNATLRANAGAQGLEIGPGTADLSLVAFFARTAAPLTRSAFAGYPSAGSIEFRIQNELANGDVNLVTAGTGKALANSNQIWHAGNQNFLTGSTTLNGLAVVSGGVTGVNITVTGAQPGDVVSIGHVYGAMLTAGMIISATVTSADTVTIVFYNPTGGTLSQAGTTTLKALVRRG